MALVGVAMGALAVGAHVALAPHSPPPQLADALRLSPELQPLTKAEFGTVKPTSAVRRMANWVVRRQDNGWAPFLIIDKRDARLYVFKPNGRLAEATPVLLGSAMGDDSFPGVGDIPVLEVQPHQRTTPAGRFVTQPGVDLEREDIVWVDYDAAVAIHRAIDKVRAEQRPERLASASPTDNRISFGCINVPVDFYDRQIAPVFGRRKAVAYILPEVKTFAQTFERGDSAVVATKQATPPPGGAAIR